MQKRKSSLWLVAVLTAMGVCGAASAQRNRGNTNFGGPKVGDRFPAVSVYDADGKALKTGDLQGHYTVLTFGCLT